MTLRIGSRRGFTLVEVMLASAVLALGTVLIYESYFTLLNSYEYVSDYLKVSPWVEEKSWQAQNEITHSGGQATIDTAGEFMIDGRKFISDLRTLKLSEEDNLYKIDLAVSRAAGTKKFRLTRGLYAIYEKK